MCALRLARCNAAWVMVLQAASAALWSPALGPPVGCRAAAALVALVPQRAWRTLGGAACDASTDRLTQPTRLLSTSTPPPPSTPSPHFFLYLGQVGFTPTGRAARTVGVDVGVDARVDARLNAWVDTVPVLIRCPRPERPRWRGCSRGWRRGSRRVARSARLLRQLAR